MRTGQRTIQDGSRYDQFFPDPQGNTVVIKKQADIPDTVSLMKKVIRETLNDTRRIAQQLKASNVYETCRRVWDFTFNHLQYKRDRYGREEVRRPARAWRDGNKGSGVDCDCMTVFVGSILTNLKIPFRIRLTSYKQQENEDDEFEHVYPVAVPQGQQVIMDCVVHQFDYEVPFKNKKDITMELHYLNGIDGDDFAQDAGVNLLGALFGDEFSPDELGLLVAGTDLEGLEGKAERKAKRVENKQIRKATPLKQRVKNTIQKINKVNPVTATLRAGILAAMKLNVMNIAGKLRFAYLSQDQANKNNMNPGKYAMLQTIRQRLEKIFTGAGGNVKNLKEAILKGKGNKDKRVALSGLEGIEASVNDWQDLNQILGLETISDEFTNENLGGIEGLGVVTAAAALASASGVIGTIYSLIKKLGEIFKKGTPQNVSELTQEREAQTEDATRKFSKDGIAQYVRLKPKGLQPIPTGVKTPDAPIPLPKYEAGAEADEVEDEADVAEGETTPTTTNKDGDSVNKDGDVAVDNTNKDDKSDTTDKGIMAWITANPGKSALIGGGILATIVGVAVLVKRSKKKGQPHGASLSGVRTTKKRNKKKKAKTHRGSATTPARQRINKLELL